MDPAGQTLVFDLHLWGFIAFLFLNVKVIINRWLEKFISEQTAQML